MANRHVTMGNHTVAQAALIAGCDFYGGYPITPSSEIAQYMSGQMPLMGRAFIQMEDEISSLGSCIGAALTGLGWYDNLTKFGCAGTLVPITGFANAVVSPALEFKSEGLVLGMSTKMFVIAGPVIVFGMIASVIYGIILAIIG